MSSATLAKPIYSVDLIKVGEADVRGPEVWWMSHWDEWETLFFYSVLVRGPGHKLLINTGPGKDTRALDKIWVQYSGHTRAAMRLSGHISESLVSLGTTADEITDIILSPFQSYSAADLMHFGNARIHLSKRGWVEFHAPDVMPADQTSNRDSALPRDVLIHLVTDGWSKVRLLDDEDEVIPGIDVFRAGVHHPESLAVVIPTRYGPIVWTDGLFKLGNFERAHPVGLTRSLRESAVLQQRVEAIDGIVLPAFDDTLLDRYARGSVA